MMDKSQGDIRIDISLAFSFLEYFQEQQLMKGMFPKKPLTIITFEVTIYLPVSK